MASCHHAARPASVARPTAGGSDSWPYATFGVLAGCGPVNGGQSIAGTASSIAGGSRSISNTGGSRLMSGIQPLLLLMVTPVALGRELIRRTGTLPVSPSLTGKVPVL